MINRNNSTIINKFVVGRIIEYCNTENSGEIPMKQFPLIQWAVSEIISNRMSIEPLCGFLQCTIRIPGTLKEVWMNFFFAVNLFSS